MKLNKLIPLMLLIMFWNISVLSQTVEHRYTKKGYKYVKHGHSENSYQHIWCSAHSGIEEYKNKDFTRVDCLTSTHAVEFNFANKWAESVGQALHYQLMTGKSAKVVLILENPQAQMVYFNRIKNLGEIHNFDAEFITPKILKLDANGRCQNKECKCWKK